MQVVRVLRPHLMLLGGLVFWVPDIIVHLARGDAFSSIDILALTILLPFATLAAFGLLIRNKKGQGAGIRVAIPMVAGVWFLGPILMTLGLTLQGQGFLAASELSKLNQVVLLILYTIFPIYTYIMSTYDGSLFALLLATVSCLLVGVVVDRRRVSA